MIYRFEILGRPISQKNNKQIVWPKEGRFSKSKKPISPLLVDSSRVKTWRKSAEKQLGPQWQNKRPLEGSLAVVVESYLGTRQRGDTDNLAIGPLDALQKAKIVKNDNCFDSVVSIRHRDKDNPRVEIFITDNDLLEVSIRPKKGNEIKWVE